MRAEREFRLDRGEDALRLDWRDHGLTYVNPPYGDAIGDFMRRIVYFAHNGVEVIALVPNRTDTAWYQNSARSVTAKCEWRGRLVHPRGAADQLQVGMFPGELPPPPESGTAPFPSAVLYWGDRPGAFERAFEDAGLIWARAGMLWRVVR